MAANGRLNMADHIAIGTQVRFDIAQGLALGEAIIRAADYDDGWLYLLDVMSGDRGDSHRNEFGELWVCDFEITVIAAKPVDTQ